MDRWTEDKANAWWDGLPWICGFNFLPSSAVNFLEMWRAETFDAVTIERELGWAAEIGFNAIRINLPYLVWKEDRDGLMTRLDRVMGVAKGMGITTVPCLFDDCGFGGAEPEFAPQPDPVPGVHNSRAVASPGRVLLMERSEWAGFEAYVRDVIATYREDPRVLFWDLYNEPGNRMIFAADGSRVHEPDFTAQSLALVRDSFAWARGEQPVQPLSVGAWSTPAPGSGDAPYQSEADRLALELSDIVTFHAYWDAPHVARFMDHLAELGRPMLCTEWMARAVGSRIDDQLALYKARKVGCFQWGLVQGRTQTYLPWPEDIVAAHAGTADRSVWFHDLLTADGTPYRQSEVDTIRRLTGQP